MKEPISEPSAESQAPLSADPESPSVENEDPPEEEKQEEGSNAEVAADIDPIEEPDPVSCLSFRCVTIPCICIMHIAGLVGQTVEMTGSEQLKCLLNIYDNAICSFGILRMLT